MICRLNHVRASREELTYMTTFASTVNILVTCSEKHCGGKSNSGIVADTALLFCRDVINNLGCCDTCVVAGGAIVGIYAQVGKGYAGKGG